MRCILQGEYSVGETLNLIYSNNSWRRSRLPTGYIGLVINKISESIFELEVTRLSSAQVVPTMAGDSSLSIVAKLDIGATAGLKVRHE